MSRKHYSAWDVLSVALWPEERVADLRALAERMHLSAQSAAAQKERRRWRKLGAALRELRPLRPITWIRFATATRFPTALVVGAVLLLLLMFSNLPTWFFALVVVAISALSGLFNRASRPDAAVYYLVTRRLREHGLVRRAPPAFTTYVSSSQTVGDELERRREGVRAWLARPARGKVVWGIVLGEPLTAVLVCACFATFGLLAYLGPAQLRLLSGPGPALLIAPFLLGPIILRQVLFSRMKRRAKYAARDGECPDCGYSLVGLPSRIQEAAEAGPSRCPECSSPWPLIPPALLVFDEDLMAFPQSASTGKSPDPVSPQS